MADAMTPAQERLLARLLDVDRDDLPAALEQVETERQEALADETGS